MKEVRKEIETEKTSSGVKDDQNHLLNFDVFHN